MNSYFECPTIRLYFIYVLNMHANFHANRVWCCTESVGWTLWLRWTTRGCGKPTKWIQNQKGGRSEPTKHPLMAKLVSQGRNSNFFWKSSVRGISYHRFVQTGHLYRDLEMVISLVTSPRFTKANEFGDNFLNG